MVIKIDNDKIVQAKYSEAYSFSIFGMPKIHLVCGHCSFQFATREYLPHTTTREAIAHCPSCSYWNETGLEVL